MTQARWRGGGAGDGILLAFPSSNQNVRADLRTLERARMLSVFCTTIAWRRSERFTGVFPSSIRQELKRRAFEGIDPARIVTFPVREIVRLIADRLGLTALTRHEAGWASVDRVSKDFDHHVAQLIRRSTVRAAAVYAYEYAAKASFEAAIERGMRRFYELPTGYWRAGLRILGEERELNPEWAETLHLLHDSPQKREHKDAEIRAANHIMVPSAFVRETLREHPEIKGTIDVIPYGAPEVRLSDIQLRSHPSKLRLLYVGNLTQLKGLSYLFAAMRILRGAASLTLIGARPAPDCGALTAALREHEWLGSMPHQRVLEIMERHDLLVFPTLFDGFGLVILEAMARGLPVITTPHAGGSSVIEHGKDGFVVPIRDAGAIAARVLELDGDRQKLAAMSKAALEKAKQMSWEARASAFLRALRLHLDLPDRKSA